MKSVSKRFYFIHKRVQRLSELKRGEVRPQRARTTKGWDHKGYRPQRAQPTKGMGHKWYGSQRVWTMKGRRGYNGGSRDPSSQKVFSCKNEMLVKIIVILKAKMEFC